MSLNPVLFKQILIVVTAVTLWTIWRRLSLVRLGRPAEKTRPLGKRVFDLFRYGLGQGRVMAKPFGLNHAVLFWSFLFLLIHHPMVAGIETVLGGELPAGSLIPYPRGMILPVMMILDLLAFLGLAAAVIAIGRRIFSPPYPEGRTCSSFLMPVLFALIFCAHFGVSTFKINYFLSAAAQDSARHWMPVSNYVAELLAAKSLESLYDVSWWGHSIAVMLLIACLPYSKFMHIITAAPNILFRRQEQPVVPDRESFKVGNSFGIDRIDGYTWKDLLDTFSCTECGRCQMACPADQTGKRLNPRVVIAALKHNLMKNGPLLKQSKPVTVPLIGEGENSISEEAIWSCTTCGACMEACPVFIEQMPKLIPLRRHLVETEAKFPEELLNLFENMEGRSNPWGIAPSERTKWCSQLDVKPFDSDTTEYLFYVGCAGSFDSRNKHVSVAMAQLLDKSGITWGILGKDEKCCGDSVRRLGNEYVFDKMARENVAMFIERGVKKVVTQCPHCFTTLKNDYRQYGLELEVIHHSELLRDLVQDGRLVLDKTTGEMGTTVFHDSCYLGRHNDVYAAPRAVIEAATGQAPLEMERNHSNAFCCGAGGGRMWMEEHVGERINLTRVNEAMEQSPDTICVACPYCMTMFEDGLKDVKADNVKVRDVAEIMAEALLR
ncbi:MAG: (Fe-S)-binding protein [Desulfuromonadaceae bacterium]